MLKIKRSPLLITLRRVSIIFIASTALLNLLLIVVPYIVLRLMYPQFAYLPDPKGFAFYEFAPFYILAILSLPMLLMSVFLLPINSLLLLIGWRGINLTERRWNVGLCLFGVAVIGLMLSPIGRMITVWLLD